MKNFPLIYPLQKQFYTDISSARLSKDPTIIEFKNGLYQGDFQGYKRHGKGIFLWDLGQIYIGNFLRTTFLNALYKFRRLGK